MKIRLLVLLSITIIYSLLCSFLYDNSPKGARAYTINDNNQKVSNNETFVEKNYYARVVIPKIGIDRELYPIGSKENNVDKNIEILKSSSMPDEPSGNFILAAHSGLSPIAYFHNLHKLEVGDEVIVSYDGNDYLYVISKMYDVEKTGKVAIKRDKSKTSITMITCKGEHEQLVVIGYLK